MINDNQLNLSDDAITVIMEFLAKDKELTKDLLSLMSVDRRFRAIGQKNKIIESLDFGNLAQYGVRGNITSFINFIGKFTDLKYLRLPMWFTDQDLSQLKQQDNFARLKKLDLNGCYQLTNLPDQLPPDLIIIGREDLQKQRLERISARRNAEPDEASTSNLAVTTEAGQPLTSLGRNSRSVVRPESNVVNQCTIS